jgi:hypothetical protein
LSRLYFEDLRARNDALSEAKLQAEIQKEVERGVKLAMDAILLFCMVWV